MNTAAAIELLDVRKRLGRFELGPLRLNVPRGVVVALIGNNGAGKTTTLDLVMGSLSPDAGAIRVLGLEHPRDAVGIKARTAYVTPDLDFSPWVTVGGALNFVSAFYPDWSQERSERLLHEFQLSRLDWLAGHSFGERMKFLLITALSRDPDLLLLDEPTAGLDVHAQHVLTRAIGVLRQREERTIVISSHQVSYLERLADYVVILHHGQLLVADDLNKLLDRFLSIDVTLGINSALPNALGLRLINQFGDRARFLFDKAIARLEDLQIHGYQIINQSKVSLEDLIAALTGGE